MGSQVVRTRLRREEFCRQRGCTDRLNRLSRDRAKKRFARYGNENGASEPLTQCRNAAEDLDGRLRVAAEEKAHSRIDNESIFADAGSYELVEPLIEKTIDR